MSAMFSIDQLQALHRSTSATGQTLLELLESHFGLGSSEALARLAEITHYPVMARGELERATPAFDLLPFHEAVRRQCIVAVNAEGEACAAIGNPFETTTMSWAEALLSRPINWHLAHPSHIAAALATWERSERAVDTLSVGDAANGSNTDVVADISLAKIADEHSPAVKLVNSTIYDAMASSASDIHLEATVSGLTIRYRLDGVLCHVKHLGGVELAEQTISRLKVMSELDIAERRIPQDGRFKAAVNGRDVDFRVSIMPSAFGEDAVLRILDKQALADQASGLTLESLGFDEAMRRAIRKLSKEPYGMLLVTGPTGSGKSTTLYASIGEINTGEDKIITIEDPIEYQLPGVLQIPVNEKKGLTFARGLRSILRHDPDKILVGEIRDADTAQIAVQAALTGHLVFTTVHANNVFDVLGRFSHMGIDTYSFVSALNGILAQRLIRVICKHCAEATQPSTELLLDSGLDPDKSAAYRFTHGRGCDHCRGTGYKGRRAIAELLPFSDAVRELIITRSPVSRIKEAALRNGYRPLRDAALELVRQGETTLQEINRVTFVS